MNKAAATPVTRVNNGGDDNIAVNNTGVTIMLLSTLTGVKNVAVS